MVNVFPDRLREIVELDEYLLRVQQSMLYKQRKWKGRKMDAAALVAETLRSRMVEIRRAIRQEMDSLILNIPVVLSSRGTSVPLQPFLRLAIDIDIQKADTVASLWRYCGLGVQDGMADTTYSMRAGVVVRFSRTARQHLYWIRRAIVQKRSPYFKVFDEYFTEQARRGISSKLAYRRAARYVTKLWLKHLWLVWRRQEGLPLGVHHPDDRRYLAAEYGWL